MKQAAIHQAKTHLFQLVKEALKNEIIIVITDNKSLVKQVVAPKTPKRRQIDIAPGFILYMADNFDAPPGHFMEESS